MRSSAAAPELCARLQKVWRVEHIGMLSNNATASYSMHPGERRRGPNHASKLLSPD